MSTVLTNGIIIPDNGSRNWGGDLANNWNILDVNVGYMTDVKNKVTTLENSVAENTANIEINASNISALQTSKQDNLSEQQLANITDVTNKANDSDVVHKSGDETISGIKNFNDVVLGEQSGVIRIGNNVQGALFCNLYYDGRIYNNSKRFVPATTNEYNLGTSTTKWKTINGIDPGALSLPGRSSINIDTSDTSKWFLDGTNIGYTPTFNGWLTITIKCSSINDYINVSQNGLYNSCSYNSSGHMRVILPVNASAGVSINAVGDAWGHVRLFPCQGNV